MSRTDPLLVLRSPYRAVTAFTLASTPRELSLNAFLSVSAPPFRAHGFPLPRVCFRFLYRASVPTLFRKLPGFATVFCFDGFHTELPDFLESVRGVLSSRTISTKFHLLKEFVSERHSRLRQRVRFFRRNNPAILHFPFLFSSTTSFATCQRVRPAFGELKTARFTPSIGKILTRWVNFESLVSI